MKNVTELDERSLEQVTGGRLERPGQKDRPDFGGSDQPRRRRQPNLTLDELLKM